MKAGDRKKLDREEHRRLQEDDDIRSLLALPHGRRVIFRLIEETARVFSGSISTDPYATAFNEGRRDVGITLMRRVQQAAPESYIQALADALAERREAAHDEAERQKEARGDNPPEADED